MINRTLAKGTLEPTLQMKNTSSQKGQGVCWSSNAGLSELTAPCWAPPGRARRKAWFQVVHPLSKHTVGGVNGGQGDKSRGTLEMKWEGTLRPLELSISMGAMSFLMVGVTSYF